MKKHGFSLFVVFVSCGLILFMVHSTWMPAETWLGNEVPIDSAFFSKESGYLRIEMVGGDYYRRDLDDVIVEKRSDSQSYTSAVFSFTGVKLLVPVDEDVVTWRNAIQEAKAQYAAYLKIQGKRRVLPW